MTIQYWLNNVAIKSPTTFEIERFKLTKSGRLQSGKMVMDVIAKKRKFRFSYEVLSHVEFNKILGIVDSNLSFFTFEYMENNIRNSATVYGGAVRATKFRTGAIWYWKGVTFDLIEQ